jgi:hypothetical protein
MMRITPEQRRLRMALDRVREADAAHELVMQRICSRGGKNVERVRAMGMARKDAFIFAHRDKPTESIHP